LSKKAARLLRRIGEGESQEFVFHGPYADAKERSAEAWASRLTRKFAEYRDAANARNELTLHTLRAGYITPTCESRVQRRSDKAACATRRYSDFAPLHRSDRRIISRGP
jgi:integrase